MLVYLVKVTDWDAGEADIWGVFSSEELAYSYIKELSEDENLDIYTEVSEWEVTDNVESEEEGWV